MIEFLPLASSSDGCCYRLSGGGASAPLLLEAGTRFDLIRQGLDFRVTELAGCLVTHAHGDHSRSVREVARAGVDVYATAETFASLPTIGHRARTVREEVEFTVGDWRVMPFATVHDSPGSVGFLIGSPQGHRFLFLTDTAYTRHTFPGLTHVAAEANWSSELIRQSAQEGRVHGDRFKRTVSTHLSIERLLEMLKANDLSKVEKIWLLHLSAENSDEVGFKRLVEEATGVPTEVCAERAGVRF